MSTCEQHFLNLITKTKGDLSTITYLFTHFIEGKYWEEENAKDLFNIGGKNVYKLMAEINGVRSTIRAGKQLLAKARENLGKSKPDSEIAIPIIITSVYNSKGNVISEIHHNLLTENIEIVKTTKPIKKTGWEDW